MCYTDSKQYNTGVAFPPSPKVLGFHAVNLMKKMKLKNVQAYEIKDVPDHLTYECTEFGKEITKQILKLSGGKAPNVILGALTFAHAAFIKMFISDDPEELKKATLLYAKALVKNVEWLSGLNFLGEADEE